VFQLLAEAGIDVAADTAKLEDQGVDSFTKDYQKLLAALEEKRRQYLAAPAAHPAGIGG